MHFWGQQWFAEIAIFFVLENQSKRMNMEPVLKSIAVVICNTSLYACYKYDTLIIIIIVIVPC